MTMSRKPYTCAACNKKFWDCNCDGNRPYIRPVREPRLRDVLDEHSKQSDEVAAQVKVPK